MTADTLPSALIGYTGFVGSNLARDDGFDDLFNSSNIQEIRGRKYHRVVCAGVTAAKWWANANAGEDRARIAGLMDHLRTIQTDRFVLISTIDVYGQPIGVTERDEPPTKDLHAYGLNRLELERFVSTTFPTSHIVRLPALFGPNLKKNALYDLMNDHRLEYISPDGVFQWYPVPRLADDLRRIERDGPGLVNVATEPLAMRSIIERFFPGREIGALAAPAARYDMRTVYPDLLGGTGHYHMTADQVMDAFAAFLAR